MIQSIAHYTSQAKCGLCEAFCPLHKDGIYYKEEQNISYLVCHMEKYHKTDIYPVEKENERDENYEASNPQINSERTKDNYILENMNYCGHTVNFTTKKKSYKNKKKIRLPREDWVIFKDTHEALIDEDTYETVQRIRKAKRKQTDMGEMSVFSGIVYCADCGKKMYLCRCSKSTQKEYFNCSTYRKKSKSLCTSHQITVEAVEHIVLTDLQRVLGMAKDNEKQFVNMVQTAKSKEIRKDLSAKTKECDEAEKRVKALDRIIQSLYEDKVCGNLTDERFVKMSQAYEQEQETLTERIKVLRKELSTAKEDADNVTKFMRLVKRYTEITELTPEVVREFIEKVIVHQAEKVNGKKRQAVEIIYNCVGVIPNPTQE